MTVKNVYDITMRSVTAGERTTMQVLIGADEGPHFAMRRFCIGAGGSMPTHTNTVEHEQYVLGGRAEVWMGEDTHEVAAGDIVFIPAGVPHGYRTVGEETFEFLCLVPNAPDHIEIVDSGG